MASRVPSGRSARSLKIVLVRGLVSTCLLSRTTSLVLFLLRTRSCGVSVEHLAFGAKRLLLTLLSGGAELRARRQLQRCGTTSQLFHTTRLVLFRLCTRCCGFSSEQIALGATRLRFTRFRRGEMLRARRHLRRCRTWLACTPGVSHAAKPGDRPGGALRKGGRV